MKEGEIIELESEYAGDPRKEKRMRELTRRVGERNAVRMAVNSTGAFPVFPEEGSVKKDTK